MSGQWYYMDLDDKTWGPFKSKQMEKWFVEGKVKGDLRVSNKKSGPFCKLGALGDTPFAEISKTSLESTKKWWYRVDKKCFGPFSTQLMRTWYTNKKLPSSLLISVSENGPFVPLFTFPEPRFEWIKEVREERRSIVKLVTKVPSRRRMTTVNQKVESFGSNELSDSDEDTGVKHPLDILMAPSTRSPSPPQAPSYSKNVFNNTRSPGPTMFPPAPTTYKKWVSYWRRHASTINRLDDTGVRYGFELSWQGACPWRPKPNQDRCTGFTCERTNSCVVAVMDGHGPVGHEASDFLMRHLENVLTSDPDWNLSPPEKAVERAALKLDSLLTERSGIDCTLSGSTFVIGVIRHGQVTIGNVGDSTLSSICIRGDEDRTYVKQISEDHKPESPEETMRITKAGGLVFAVDPDGRGPQGPVRVWRKEKDGPGIAMSRSLGDTMATSVGVIARPDVTTYSLKDEDVFGGRCVGFLLASDALYEFMNGDDVAKVLTKKKICGDRVDGGHLLQDLAEEIQKRWKYHEDGYVDDTTLLLVTLER